MNQHVGKTGETMSSGSLLSTGQLIATGTGELPPCPNECAGNGLCFNGKCVCSEGWFGPDCSGKICPPGKMGPKCLMSACPRGCDGKGLCFNGHCECPNTHTGPDCSIPVGCMEACGETCLADLTSEKCEFCKGSCITLLKNPFLGRHDPLYDRLLTMQLKNETKKGFLPTSPRSAAPLHAAALVESGMQAQ